MFSKACEYGIRAALYIAEKSQDDERVSLQEIAKEIDGPVAFTAKILQKLVHAKVLQSQKGPTGGFMVDKKDMPKIMIHRIVDAIDGDNIYKGCGLGLKKCSEVNPCPVHDKFKAIRQELSYMLETTSLAELAEGLKEGRTVLKIG